MIYFYQNPEYTAQWQQAYQELNMKCLQLSNDYSKAVQLRTSLKDKIQNLVRQNEEIKRKRVNTKTGELSKQQLSIAESFQPCLEKITIKPEKMMNQKIKVQRTAESDTKLEGQAYVCTYDDCQKVYSSPVSMNLHIKMKHNGGTKKEREAYARILLEAEDRGEQHPKIDINLPPNFLEEYRTSYEYMKKYSM